MKTFSTRLGVATVLIVLAFTAGCKKKTSSGSSSNPPVAGTNVPTLTTLTVTSITDTSAVSGGVISSAGDGSILAAGLCWDIAPNPTISGNKTSDYQNNMSFSGTLKGLVPDMTYYVRAYATNAHGTAYGNEISFTSGKGWINLNGKFPVAVAAKCIVPLGGDLFVATSTQGVFKSGDYGNSWTAMNSGLSSFNITDMTVEANTLLLSTDAGVFTSNDQGASWVQSNTGLSSMDIRKIEASGGKILACDYSNVFLSEDNGMSWKKIYSLIPPGSFQAFHVKGPEISLFLSGGISKRIWYSGDNGQNWTNKDFGVGAPSYYINSAIPIGDDFLLATSSGAELLKKNATSTVIKNKDLDLSSAGFTRMVGNFQVVYASTYNRVYLSTNDGDTWIALKPDLPNVPNQVIKELLVHANNYVYVIRPDAAGKGVLYRYKNW